MSPPATIPVLRVRGSHREVGRQIGEACAGVLRRSVDLSAEGVLPAGRTAEAQLALAAEYLAVTQRALPWLIEELDGVAEGAGVDPEALFAASVEEIWTVRPSQPEADAIVRGRCSDLVAVPPATAGGSVLVAHNNDLSPGTEEELIAIEWDVPGDPLVFTIGIGPWISVGWNAGGLSLTGNELSPNDDRVGVSRLLQVRDMLRRPTLEGAVEAALRPERASSYNNMLAHRDGRVVNVEGSATDAELTAPDDRGVIAHTNHYVCERMLGYEGDPEYALHSARRYRRAGELLGAAARDPGSITEEALRAMLADHENAPDSLCRHPELGSTSKTVFWCVADVTRGRITFGRGNPCDSAPQAYAFA